MDRKTFIEGIGRLQQAYPRTATLTKGQAELWFEMLKDLDGRQFVAGIISAIQEGDAWPTIATIRKACQQANGDGLTAEDRAASLWLTVRRAARSLGGDVSVQFDDALTNATVRAVFGGWVKFCEMESRDIDRCERRFSETYGRLMASGVTAKDAAALPGRIDLQRARIGADMEGARLVETGLATPSGLRIRGTETQLRLTLKSASVPEVVRQTAATFLQLPELLQERKEQREAQAIEDNEATRAEFKERQQAATAALRERLTTNANEGETR